MASVEGRSQPSNGGHDSYAEEQYQSGPDQEEEEKQAADADEAELQGTLSKQSLDVIHFA